MVADKRSCMVKRTEDTDESNIVTEAVCSCSNAPLYSRLAAKNGVKQVASRLRRLTIDAQLFAKGLFSVQLVQLQAG